MECHPWAWMNTLLTMRHLVFLAACLLIVDAASAGPKLGNRLDYLGYFANFLGIALGRARIIPPWAAWSLVLTSPITLIAFPTHLHELLYLVIALWFVGSVPAALAVWRSRFGVPA